MCVLFSKQWNIDYLNIDHKYAHQISISVVFPLKEILCPCLMFVSKIETSFVISTTKHRVSVCEWEFGSSCGFRDSALPLYSCAAEVDGDGPSQHWLIANENCSDWGSSCPRNQRRKKKINEWVLESLNPHQRTLLCLVWIHKKINK